MSYVLNTYLLASVVSYSVYVFLSTNRNKALLHKFTFRFVELLLSFTNFKTLTCIVPWLLGKDILTSAQWYHIIIIELIMSQAEHSAIMICFIDCLQRISHNSVPVFFFPFPRQSYFLARSILKHIVFAVSKWS